MVKRQRSGAPEHELYEFLLRVMNFLDIFFGAPGMDCCVLWFELVACWIPWGSLKRLLGFAAHPEAPRRSQKLFVAEVVATSLILDAL